MRRGFKTEARKLALDVRDEIGIGPEGPFDPHALADLYGIRVLRVSELGLTSASSTAISGALIAVGTGRLILENDAHSEARCRLTVSHEMSHVVLEHEFATMIVDPTGCRDLIGDQEDEATVLAGEMVLPTDTAIKWAIRGRSDVEVAQILGISVEAARWRMNTSGGRKIAERTHAKRRG